MTDHIHDLPVCGYGGHNPHAPSCTGKGKMIACGEIVDPADPNFGKALCRHEEPAPVAGGADNNNGGGNNGGNHNGEADTPAGNTPTDTPSSSTDEPTATGENGPAGSNLPQPGTSSGSPPIDEPTDSQPIETGPSWLKTLGCQLLSLISWLLNLIHTLIRFGFLPLILLLWLLASSWPGILTLPGFLAFLRFLWYWTFGLPWPDPFPDTLPPLPPIRPLPNDPPLTGEPEPDPPVDTQSQDPLETPEVEEPQSEEPTKPAEPEPIAVYHPQGGDCEVDYHWWFGRWVRCKGGKRCPAGKHCRLLWRRRGSTEHWADAGIVKGGSVKFSTYMEYRCLCRRTPY